MLKEATSKSNSAQHTSRLAGMLRGGTSEPYNNQYISKETELKLFEISEDIRKINNSWMKRTLDSLAGVVWLSRRNKHAKKLKEMIKDVNVALYVTQDYVFSRTKLSPKGLTATHFAVVSNPIVAHVALEDNKTVSISDKRGFSVAHAIAYHYTKQSFSKEIIDKILMIKSIWEISAKNGQSVKDVIESS